jgi:hypothetical protein
MPSAETAKTSVAGLSARSSATATGISGVSR